MKSSLHFTSLHFSHKIVSCFLLAVVFQFLNFEDANASCNPQPTVYINSYVAYSTPMSIYSDIEIQSGGTLDITGTTVNIISGGHITIKNGGNLIVNGSTLSNACTYMWGGIINQSGGRLTITNSTIENAEYAVELEAYTDNWIEKSIFDKNYIGIYTKPASTPTTFLTFYLDAVTFKCSGTLIANTVTTASSSFAGIDFNNTNAVIEGASTQLEFQNLNIGICLKESNIDIMNSHFENIQPDVVYGNYFDGSAIYANGNNGFYSVNVTGLGYGISPETINRSRFGIYIVTLNSRIFQCGINDVSEGVIIYKCPDRDVSITETAIYASKFGMNIEFNDFIHSLVVADDDVFINYTGSSSGGIGINVADVGLAPTNNKQFERLKVHTTSGFGGILLTDVNYSHTFDCDIYIYDSPPEFGWKVQGGRRNELKCNSVNKYVVEESTEKCLYCFVETNDPIIRCNVALNGEIGAAFTGNCGQADFKYNTFQDNTVSGLYLNSTAIMGLQDNSSNIWLNTITPTTAICAGCFPAFSKFIVQSYSPFEPSIIFPGSGWFFNTTSPPYNTCTGICMVSSEDGEEKLTSEEQYLISNGSLNMPDFSEELDEYVRQEIIEKIPNLEESEISYIISNFYSSFFVGDLYDYQVKKNILSTPISTSSQSNDEFINLEELKYKIAVNHAIDILLKDSIYSSIERDSMQYVKEINLANSDYNYSEIDLLASPSIQQNEFLISNFESLNNSITSMDLIYQNQQAVDEIYAISIGRGNFNLSNTQITVLEGVANQCPLEGGNAVFVARSILSISNRNMMYDDYLNCTQTGISMKKKKSDELPIRLYPNPTNGIVNVKYFSEVRRDFSIEFFDMLGKNVLVKNILGAGLNESIDLSELPPAIYLYSITSDGERNKGYIVLE